MRVLNSLREELRQMIFTIITEMNSESTERELNMIIADKVLDTSLAEDNIKVINAEDNIDSNEYKPNGAWVYRSGDIEDWIFERFNSIAEAIRKSINTVGSMVLFNGNEIKYNQIDDETAYYLASDGKFKVVKL